MDDQEGTVPEGSQSVQTFRNAPQYGAQEFAWDPQNRYFSGNNESNVDGGDGANGSPNSDVAAAGGTGTSSDNNSGGVGGIRLAAAANGNNGNATDYGSGAGGGGIGRIRLNGREECLDCPFTMVP